MPKEVELSFFTVLDLGSHAATEWEAEDLAKRLKTIYSKNKKLRKSYQGHIHSHHGMGAYFSGTDTDTMEEHASRDGFFFSLVVAHTKTKYAFSMSYLDQYGRPNIIEADEKDIFTALPANPNKEWVAEWKEIKKAYNQAVTVTPGRTYGNQMSLGGNYGMNSWNKSFEVKKAHEVKEEKEKQAKYRILLSKYDMDQIEYDEFAKDCKKLGIDELDMYGNEVLSGY